MRLYGCDHARHNIRPPHYSLVYLQQTGPRQAGPLSQTVVEVRAVNAEGRDLSMNPPTKGEVPFFVRVWVNDILAFDSRLPKKDRAKSARLRKGANTVVVEWQTNVDGGSAAESIAVQFNDAKTGKPVPDLFFDMDKR